MEPFSRNLVVGNYVLGNVGQSLAFSSLDFLFMFRTVHQEQSFNQHRFRTIFSAVQASVRQGHIHAEVLHDLACEECKFFVITGTKKEKIYLTKIFAHRSSRIFFCPLQSRIMGAEKPIPCPPGLVEPSSGSSVCALSLCPGALLSSKLNLCRGNTVPGR